MSPENEFLDDILGQIYHQIPSSVTDVIPKLSGVSLNIGIGMNFEVDKEQPAFTKTFRYQITRMLEVLRKERRTTVFLIDEAQKHSDEMRTFIATYQHLVMEGFDITMLLAGLPSAVHDILSDNVLTFLRRAKQVQLQNIQMILVETDYHEIFSAPSFELSDDVIKKAAQATYGYSYLVQLIGYYLWENSIKYDEEKALTRAISESKAMLYQNVYELMFNELSGKDKEFLIAMAKDSTHTKFGDIALRMDQGKNYISTYRFRLITNGIIKAAGYGYLDFALPYLNEFVRDYSFF